jgi:hypothetical protein
MKHEKADGDDDWYQIHEVHYNSKRKPEGWTVEGIAPGGNTLEDLRDELIRMLEATEKNILNYEIKNDQM